MRWVITGIGLALVIDLESVCVRQIVPSSCATVRVRQFFAVIWVITGIGLFLFVGMENVCVRQTVSASCEVVPVRSIAISRVTACVRSSAVFSQGIAGMRTNPAFGLEIITWCRI